MKATFLRSTVAFALACAAFMSEDQARAWDSHAEARIRSMPRTIDGIGFPAQWQQQQWAAMQLVKDRLGRSFGDESPVLTKLFRCPVNKTDGTFAGCTLPEPGDAEVVAGWSNPRKAGETDHHSEHTILARAAAEYAGLTATTLFEPFWVRYPAVNGLVVARPKQKNYLMSAQRLTPVDPVPDQFSYASRAISLLELAQAPDFSHSLTDWANSNESCPLKNEEGGSDIAGAYRGNHVESCHDFRKVMGAINATHFAPLNREMWRYYHHLALTQMAECQDLAGIKAQFYDDWETYFAEPKLYSDDHTETHECERLAMAYEMFAQHFLQDTWAVGHMWQRWGATKLSQFPADVSLFDLPPGSTFPAANGPPRRALIAGMAATIAGSIHGAKSVSIGLATEHLGQWSTSFLLRFSGLDDPLNGGKYAGRWVEWSDAANQRFPGAGDLFWDPEIIGVGSPVVSTDTDHAEQRTRMLTCSAASLRRVYDLGPHAHGQPNANASPTVTATDPESDYCWEHWATNESMEASLGPLNLAYEPNSGSHAISKIIAATTNWLVLDTIGGNAADAKPGLVNFPVERVEDIPPTEPDKLERAKDRDAILSRILWRLTLDTPYFSNVYGENRRLHPKGTQTARQLLSDGTTAMKHLLDIPPVPLVSGSIPPGAPPVPRGVDYVDKLPLAATSDADLAMARMFWRGDLKRTCENALDDDAAQLNGLRDRCTSEATIGGDTEACTACVALAELVIPRCDLDIHAPIRNSKCSAAGVTDRFGLPEWWFDNYGRNVSPHTFPYPWGDDSLLHCAPSLHIATQWCSGAVPDQPGRSPVFVRSNDDFVSSQSVTCPNLITGGTYERHFGTGTERIATILSEMDDQPGRPWVMPMVSAYDSRVTTTPGADPCDFLQTNFVSSEDGRIRAMLPAGLDINRYTGSYYADAGQPRSGVIQRNFNFNRQCSSVSGLGFEMPILQQEDQVTGALALEFLSGDGVKECYVREARQFFSTCPVGLQTTPGGECVAPRANPPSLLDLSNWVPN